MRYALAIIGLLALFGCGKDSTPDDGNNNAPDGGGPPASTGSKLDRPGLPKPPTDGLPDDLRPPRE